jgi:hypothetical protein
VSVRIDRNYPLCFELYNVMVNRCRALNVQKLKPPDDYIKKLTGERLRWGGGVKNGAKKCQSTKELVKLLILE